MNNLKLRNKIFLILVLPLLAIFMLSSILIFEKVEKVQTEIIQNEIGNKSGVEEPMIDVSSTINMESLAPLMSEREQVEQKKTSRTKGW